MTRSKIAAKYAKNYGFLSYGNHPVKPEDILEMIPN
jgi:hypothetical protein